MRKLLIIVFLLGLVRTGYALDSDHLEKPFIDKDFEAVELEIKKVKDDCWEKAKNIHERLECGNDIREKFKAEGKMRGTDEYCHANYRRYNFRELQKFRRKLYDQKKAARFEPERGKRLLGEVTKLIFDIELAWIDNRLIEMQEELAKKKHDAVWNKGKKAQ